MLEIMKKHPGINKRTNNLVNCIAYMRIKSFRLVNITSQKSNHIMLKQKIC